MKTFRLLLAMLLLVGLASSAMAATVTCDIKAKHFVKKGGTFEDPEEGGIELNHTAKDVISYTIVMTHLVSNAVSFDTQTTGFTGVAGPTTTSTSGNTETITATGTGEKQHSGPAGTGGLYTIEAWIRPAGSTTTHYAHDIASKYCELP
jgi:hypothetical protein